MILARMAQNKSEDVPGGKPGCLTLTSGNLDQFLAFSDVKSTIVIIMVIHEPSGFCRFVGLVFVKPNSLLHDSQH